MKTMILANQTHQELPYSLNVCWKVFRRYLAFLLERSGKTTKDFVLDGNYEETYKHLFLHFFKSDQSKFPLSKGIYMAGEMGVGKSMIMKALVMAYNEVHKERYYHFVNTKSFSDDISITKDLTKMVPFFRNGLVIDDLGRETKASSYGFNQHVFGTILNKRYEAYSFNTTYITSNALINNQDHMKLLSSAYGSHIIDRLKEMFSFVELRSTNKRI